MPNSPPHPDIKAMMDAARERFIMDLLTTACRWHSHGTMLDDATISTCWDADRLDLGRINIRPDPNRLCTEAAQHPQVIEWAWRRSQSWLRKTRSHLLRF